MAALLPTKGNLMAAKRSLALAKTGYDLMDKKRTILIHEITKMIDEASGIQSQIDSVFSEAYKALQISNITIGTCDRIAEAVEPDNTISIRSHSVMGVVLPAISSNSPPLRMEYGLAATNSALDMAYIKFHEVKELTLKLAEIETAIYRLASSIKKTQKRANALQNIVIPNLNETIKFISDALEEKEREEFSRLKVIKAQKNR